MDLRQLRYFAHVARLRSFSKAARQLNIAQPALSRQIRNLEVELGVRLLLRNTHDVVPTEAGSRLIEMSDFILRYSDDIREAVRSTAQEPAGHIVVGMPPSIAYLVAPGLVEHVRREFPKVNLRIIEGLSVFLLEWLMLRRLDLAVLTGGEAIKGAVKTHLADQEMVLAGRRDIIAGFGRSIPFRALTTTAILITHGFRALVDQAAATASVALTYDMEVDSLPVIKQMVLEGVGLSILPYATVLREHVEGTLSICRIAEPPIIRRLYLTESEFRPQHLTVKTMKTVLESHIRKLPTHPVS